MLAVGVAVLIDDPHHGVDQKAREDTADHLEEQQLDDLRRSDTAGDQDGKHLVAGGQKHGQQGAEGDDTGGVKAGDRAGKAALRYRAEQTSQRGSGKTDLGDDAVDPLARALFDKFHQQIREEQDRQHQGAVFEAVKQTVDDDIPHIFQSLSSFISYTAECIIANNDGLVKWLVIGFLYSGKKQNCGRRLSSKSRTKVSRTAVCGTL